MKSASLKSIERKTLFVHLSVILIFFILTTILTFPVMANFGTEFAGFGADIWNNVWKWWWTKYAFENNLDWLQTDYIFYPYGVNVGKESLFTMLLAYVFQFLDYLQIWNMLWIAGFVFGLGAAVSIGICYFFIGAFAGLKFMGHPMYWSDGFVILVMPVILAVATVILFVITGMKGGKRCCC